MLTFRRRKLIIYPKFQYSLLLVNAFTLFLAFSFMAIQIYLSFNKLYDMGIKEGLPPDHTYFKFLEYHSTSLTQNLILAIIFATLISTTFLVMISHRMAGPIVRLRGHLQRFLDEGKIEPLHFRKNDYFSELPDIINRVFQLVNKQR